MWNRIAGCLLAGVVGLSATAQAQDEPTVDNDVACAVACDKVNWMDDMNDSHPLLQSTTQGMVDQARSFVNDACSNSCQRSEEPWKEE